MAKKNTNQYAERERNFKTAFSEIMNYSNEHFGDRKYIDRLCNHFYKLLENHIEDEEYYQYKSIVENLEKEGASITDADIAALFNVAGSTINRWKKGTLPPLETAVEMAEIFGVTTDYLLGVSSTPDKDTEKDYDVFKKFGISLEAFKNLTLYKEESEQPEKVHNFDYRKAKEGLNYLLSQIGTDKNVKTVRMDILTDIGYFLSQRRFDKYYYFESDDVDNLYGSLFESLDSERNFSPEYVKNELEVFFATLPRFTGTETTLVLLDNIRDNLKKYKTEITPDFFDTDI